MSFEGRKPGTPGGDKTVAYLAEPISQAGLEARHIGKSRTCSRCR